MILGLFIAMVAVFVGYVSFVVAKYGILPSISDSYYHLPEKWNFMFTLALWGFAMPAMILGTPVTGLMFGACAGIMFVGAAAQFHKKVTKTVHIIGATLGMGLSQIAIATAFGMWPITAVSVGLVGLIVLFRKQLKYKHVWWIEIVSFTAIGLVYWLYFFG